MPRKNFIKTNRYFYHVYNRSNQKVWYACPMDRVWNFALDSLAKANKRHPVEIAQFVLMRNHYHMLIRTPDENLDKFMYEFAKNFSLRLRIETNLINQMFCGRYKWSIVAHEKYLETIYQYIYQNPVRAGFVDEIWNYPYSTAYKYFIEKKITLLKIYEKSARDNVMLEKSDLISRGLKKAYFTPVAE